MKKKHIRYGNRYIMVFEMIRSEYNMMVIHTDGEIPLYELNLDSKHSILLSLWGGTYLVEE